MATFVVDEGGVEADQHHLSVPRFLGFDAVVGRIADVTSGIA
jgi:hypothetical protein